MGLFAKHFRKISLLILLVGLMAVPGIANLPVIDRDEARYAQASVQMIESGDYINIRFQDRARNKKPAGAYWAQVLSVKAFSDAQKRQIWAHRIPSVLGALLAVLALYLGGIKMLGKKPAFFGAALLSVGFIFVFEAHIAKTDALLLGFSSLALVALARLRMHGDNAGKNYGAALLFWFSLAIAVMIKGPVLPVLIFMCLLCLYVWERQAKWMSALLFWPAILLFVLIVAPWSYMIFKETGGAFFSDAFGQDLAPKLQGVQESHPGPFGYYTALIWASFWPASLFLLPGLVFGVKSAFNKENFDNHVSKMSRLLLCWSVPFFLMLEFVPTKLPHYPLIVYPALALLSGTALAAMEKLDLFKISRRISASLFLLVCIALASGLLFAQSIYGEFPNWQFALMALVFLFALFAFITLWQGKAKAAFIAMLVLAVLIYLPAYQFILPSLKQLQIAPQIKQILLSRKIDLPIKNRKIISPHYTEPSLVYHLGTKTILGGGEKTIKQAGLDIGDIVLLDEKHDKSIQFEKTLTDMLGRQGLCHNSIGELNGFNYVKGRKVKIDILQINKCKTSTNHAKFDEEPATRPVP